VFAADLDPSRPEIEDPNLCEVGREEMLRADSPELRDQAWYAGEQSIGGGYRIDGRLVAARWAWYGERYKQQRGFWPLKDGEAKIVQSFVLPEARGLGIATKMGFFGDQVLGAKGFTRMYARVWYNHTASIELTKKCGYRQIGWGVEVNPFRRKKPFKLTFKSAGHVSA
jgi:GNAT superfamily N-acetyltransferase